MATTKSKKTGKAVKGQGSSRSPLKVKINSLLQDSLATAKRSVSSKEKAEGLLLVFGPEDLDALPGILAKMVPTWQQQIWGQAKSSLKESYHFVTNQGPVWILARKNRTGPVSHEGLLEDSNYSWHRDQAGTVFSMAKSLQVPRLKVELHGVQQEQELGLFTGFEMAAYNYRNSIESRPVDGPALWIEKTNSELPRDLIARAQTRGHAVNLARHLVNVPPNEAHPQSLAQWIQAEFRGFKNLKVDVWNEQRLKKEGMGLHLGVGQGSTSAPCMVHLKYRPSGGKGKSARKPVAFVGKGISFDTGGLDIKPSAGMRLMKKDMGGAACLVGLAWWAAQAKYPYPLDFYLAFAENSVDAKSFRPSDVLTARNGMKVEIHNTDAEGRLVLADSLDVAVTQTGADAPEAVINVATLTGAIKTALGGEIAGLFSNHDPLAKDLQKSGQRAGDLNWRMPLPMRLNAGMASPFADMVNAVDGFAGAITAALFLEKFVREKPWAHLDIYAWNDKVSGPFGFSGGNGQAVQCLIEYLESR